jgi:hypothetical protein
LSHGSFSMEKPVHHVTRKMIIRETLYAIAARKVSAIQIQGILYLYN